MLCWTADGVEGESWAFVRDTGSYDKVLADLEITIIDSLEMRGASHEAH